MIPKVIHYCWFGENKLPEHAQKCIESWKKYCPDYEIKEWNEKNVDIRSITYMQQAYKEKAWCFVSDVARLQIIYKYGGIYLDADVKVIKSFDSLLKYHAFMGMEEGLLNKTYVNLGLGFGAEAGNELVGELLHDYEGRNYCSPDGSLDRTPCPILQTQVLLKNGFKQNNVVQKLPNVIIYPTEFFCPYSPISGICKITENTYSIHNYAGSWITEKERKMIQMRHKVYQSYGKFSNLIWPFLHVGFKIEQVGIKKTFSLIIERLRNILTRHDHE